MRSAILTALTALAVALVVMLPLLSSRAGSELTEVVYLESGPDDDRTAFSVRTLSRTAKPTIKATIEHARGFMPRATLSPDGTLAAVVRQPRGVPDREKAEVILIEIDSGTEEVLDVPAFALANPFFTAEGELIYVLSASRATDVDVDETQRGRPVELEYTWHELDVATRRVQAEITMRHSYVHPIGMAVARLGAAQDRAVLLMYRVGFRGADLAGLDLETHEVQMVTSLGDLMARDFDLTDDRKTLIFSGLRPGNEAASIFWVQLASPHVEPLRANLSHEASPAWAGSAAAWYFVETLGAPLERATHLDPEGRPLDSLSEIAGILNNARELPHENGVSTAGRYVAVRVQTELGQLHLIRDEGANPKTAWVLATSGLVRIAGYR